MFVENARCHAWQDNRNLLTSANLRVHPIRIIHISSLTEHYHKENNLSFIDLSLKLWKLWIIKFPLPHYFDTILSLQLGTPQFS